MNYLICFIFASICSLAVSRFPYRPKTVGGQFCKIPYDYQGKTYHNCTTDGDPRPWCRPGDRQWSYCEAAPTELANCEVAQPTISVVDVQSILDLVNNIRTKESALRMAKIRWNSELAQRAQFMSNKCQTGSDNSNLCNSDSPMGQISYMTMSSEPQPKKWTQFILEFYNKRPSYNLETNTCSAQYCNGYKQLVNAKTTEIGCAITSCNKDSTYTDYYFCNFYPPIYAGKPFEKANKTCDKCYSLNEDFSYRCNKDLCEICDSPEPDCQGKEQLQKEIESGKVCADLDPQFCQINAGVCPHLELLPSDQKEMMTSKCKKTCKLCA